jgi:nucleoside 2-deoxyribosyltransferase
MIVYLAGGINGLSDTDAKVWRAQATKALGAHGVECLDPMRRDYRGQESAHVVEIVHGDLSDIERADVVLAMCARPSWGTAMEIHYAHGRGKPVVGIYAGPQSSPWLVFHTRSLHPTINQAIAAVLALKALR